MAGKNPNSIYDGADIFKRSMSQAHADLDKATPKNIPTDVGAMLDSLKGGAQQLSPEDYARVGQATGRQDLIDGCMMSSGQRDPQHWYPRRRKVRRWYHAATRCRYHREDRARGCDG